MKPKIDKTRFGSITIGGETYENDIFIELGGQVTKRKKKLSKEVYGTSHIVSLAEAEYIFQKGANKLIIGAGQEGMLKLSDEARSFFKLKECDVILLPTPQAIEVWNKEKGAAIGLFHITC